jgi:subtilisin family serine protease
MDPLNQTKLHSLMNLSRGISGVIVGVVDGPVDFSHPALRESKIRTVNNSQLVECKKANNIACMHGTFVAGIFCAMRGLSAPSICPGCEVILYPIFSDELMNGSRANSTIPSSTPEELSKAIIQMIDAGAKVINLSLGLSSSSLTRYQGLMEAYDYALRKEVILVSAAGNQGNIGYITMLDHRWLIPVAACDTQGRLDPMSNFGHSISKRGLMAPGVNIISTAPNGNYTQMSGTSAAAPFVTGTIALLWSLFPNAAASQIVSSVTTAGSQNRRTIIPPMLDAEAALIQLKSFMK